jgi:uncharacterized protein YecE (DUF72 family)
MARATPKTAAGKPVEAVQLSKVLIGPAGWAYQDWNGVVYPTPRTRDFHQATYLAEFFDTIEINTSFYHPMQTSHAAQWIRRVAANPRFLFTAKLWQKFTHEGGTNLEDEKAVRAGFDLLRGADKLGAMLLQFPFSFHFEIGNLARLTQMLVSFRDYPLVVEVRHSSWANPNFYELLHERGVGFCNIDQPIIGRSTEPSEQVTSPIGYVRLHGRRYDTWFSDDPASPVEERYNYLYSEEELEPWAERVRNVSKDAKTTFVITNNHFQGKGVVNALQLIHMLDKKKVKVPETLRHHYPQLDAIATEPSKEPTLFPLSPK